MTQDDTAPEKKTLDLSVAQIAGSSLATVAAALLASKLGVYGTILGAGVVSVVATAGGPVIQHVFRRTGDRLRGGGRFESPRPRSPHPGSSRPRSTRPPSARPTAAGADYGEATVHGTRVRGWKRTAVASGAAFALAVGGLGAYEAAAGTSISDGGGTLLSGGTRKAADHRQPDPPASRNDKGGTDKGGTGEDEEGRDGTGKGGAASPDPARSTGGRSPAPDPTPSRSADPTPTPSPSTPGPRTTPPPTPTPPTPTAAPGSP
ncbi:hypothetical protein [Streptomyces sp. A1136]|uniref:hypothetical protein n=1 Tax=Streptomyces sp. A1136 TaxID=2563102 RepID=UPI00109EDA86|nr:hypothetical protein [Streptomyces sp. A1136]THA57215.1 hypothetical protein E6R62_07905 [Streptomyces sp. A1136]